MIRDFANPSDGDKFFPKWRHKDWFVGSSWASGIAFNYWAPDAEGRNQESVSEAVNAYDALALYGEAMVQAFQDVNDNLQAVSQDIRDTGRVMLATELEAALRLWQVCDGSCGASMDRIYPTGFTPKVVGQIWSTSAQMQTWFGSAWWKVPSIDPTSLPGTE